jgi:Flp pilus assembly protein TadG
MVGRRDLSTHRLGGKLADSRGQAAVEFVLVLPILVTFLFVIFELAVALTHWLTMNDAASVGARAAAVYRFSGQSCDAAASAAANNAANGLTLDQPIQCAGLGTPGSSVTVTVTRTEQIGLPIFGLSVPLNLSSTATQTVE